MNMLKGKFKSIKQRTKNKRGFSLVELVVVIAILAVLAMVLVPSLLIYNENSRAGKDNTNMDEVVNVIALSLADQAVYDEVLKFSVADNVSCYVDTNDENNYTKVTTKQHANGVSQYTFTSDARQLDQTPFFAAGNMRGVTITFAPNKSAGRTTFDLKQGVVNQYVQIHNNYRFGAMENLYGCVKNLIGESIEATSQKYKNSEFTVFITIGSTGGNDSDAEDAVNVYGQWSGTNLPASGVQYQIVSNRTVSEDSLVVNDAEWNEINGSKLTINPGDLNGGGSFDANTDTGNNKLTNDDFKEDEKGIYAYLVNGSTLVLRNSPREDMSNVTKVYGKLNRSVRLWADDAAIITKVDIETPILPTTCNSWFSGCENLVKVQRIWNLCTDNCTDTRQMFNECQVLAKLDLRYFNTSKVRNMDSMFNSCKNLTHITLSNFDTSNVTNMTSMFSGCESLVRLDLSGFNTSNVVGMGGMFSKCKNLTHLDLSNFNTSNVTNMANMFNTCEKLTSLDVSSFDTKNVESMYGMFNNCRSITSLDVDGFDTGKVTSMGIMFATCVSLNNLDVSNFNTSNVTNMGSMFRDCRSLNDLDVSNFNTSKLTSLDRMFWGCSSLKTLDVSGFDTTNVRSMSYTFVHCGSLEYLDVSGWNTSRVTDMGSLFSYCKSLTSVDISNFDISNVTGMSGMFNHCETITSIGDMNKINSWDVSKVTNKTAMFSNCKLTEKPSWYES